MEWITFWFANPNLHKRIIQAWKLIIHKTISRANKKWYKVVGPISAVQAILIDAGWDCQLPYKWSRPARPGEPASQTWILPHAGCED